MSTLYIVSTPIGNLEDMTIRAIRILLSVPVIACEDTRRTGQLVKLLGERYLTLVPSPKCGEGRRKYLSVRDWNEAGMVGVVLGELATGDVALVSDAGTPLLSDPGYKIVRAVREAGLAVVPVPGPFAGVAALSSAGLPTNKFMFWGFLPKKWELDPEMTHVIYESPVRAEKTVREIRDRYPGAEIVVAQELTKVHESVRKWVEGMKFKGEVTLLVYHTAEV